MPEKTHAPVHKAETKKDNDAKVEAKKEEKNVQKKVAKKEEAVVVSWNLPLSLKQGMAISRFIKYKKIDVALKDLDEVIALRKAIPFSGEIPHRKGKGMMSGRYPVDACKLFKNILKSLKGNCIANGLDLDTTQIYFASVNWASRPFKRGGRKAKRANVEVKAKEVKKKNG
jgi:ribosomal protein L22